MMKKSVSETSGFLEEARRHPCPSEENGGAVGGSSTKMEQDAPEPHGKNEMWFLFTFTESSFLKSWNKNCFLKV
jgi:hypothetical protein